MAGSSEVSEVKQNIEPQGLFSSLTLKAFNLNTCHVPFSVSEIQ